MLFGAFHGTPRIRFGQFVQKSDFLTFRCTFGIFIQNGAPRCSKNEHNNLNNIYFVPGQVRRVCKDDKEIKLNHVLAHEQIAMVVYICIPHIVAILVDDIPNGESPLDNQNSDKGFLDLVLHSYSICVPRNHVSGLLFRDKMFPHLRQYLKMVLDRSILSDVPKWLISDLIPKKSETFQFLKIFTMRRTDAKILKIKKG